MAGDAENEGGRRRDGDVQSGEWRELEGGGKYYLRGCGNGECRPLRLPIAGSCRIRDNPRRIRRSASSVPNFSSRSTNCDRTAETSREGRNSRQMRRTTIVKARIEMKLHSDTSPRDHAELSRPFHAEPPPRARTEPLSFSTKMVAPFLHPGPYRPLHSVCPPNTSRGGTARRWEGRRQQQLQRLS